MKKYLLVTACLLLSGAVLSQQKYTVNVPTVDQKHAGTVYQFYAFIGAGINFAKSRGISPYEYGKYIGNLYAPAWSPANDFDVMVKGVISHAEGARRTSDAAVQVKENPNGSVSVISDKKIWEQYFRDDFKVATMNEFAECMRGVYEPIADRMGAKSSVELKDGFLILTLVKK